MKTRYLMILTTLACLGFSIFALAAKPVCPGDHPSCKDDGGGGNDSHVHMYAVTMGGDLGGIGGVWPKKNSKWIVYKDFAQTPYNLDLSYFRLAENEGGPFSAPRGENCFGANDLLFQGILEKSKGRSAKGSFWFDGLTDNEVAEDRAPVLYRLEVFGVFTGDGGSGDWPPEDSNTMTMSDWSMSVDNEGNEIKNISCVGEGSFPNEVTIDVAHDDVSP